MPLRGSYRIMSIQTTTTICHMKRGRGNKPEVIYAKNENVSQHEICLMSW